MGADNQIVAQQMFGFQGRKIQGYLGNVRTRGGELFYHDDPTGNVTDLTDHLGSEVLKYRYDAFGGVFTQLWTPYNQVGLTGKSYDIKASLMDYSARWYSPSAGRFTTQDTWAGFNSNPQTLNRYAYALNNPITITDPSGHMPCYEGDDGSLHCGYGNPDNYGTYDSGGGSSGGGDNGGGGGNTGGGGVTPPWWMNLPDRESEYNVAAGDSPQEEQDRYHRDLQSQLMFLEGDYNNNLPYQENFDIWLQDNKIYGPQTDQELRDAIQRDQENLKNAGYCHDLSQAGGNIANDPTCKGILLTQAMGQGHDSASAMFTSGAPIIAGSVLSGFNSIRRSLPISLPEDGLSSSEEPLNIGSGQTESNTSAAEGTGQVDQAIVNSKGDPYPKVQVEGYGKVPLPDGPYTPNNSKLLRPQFTASFKNQFKEWWTSQGRPWPEGNVNIHHIKPLSKGGDNSFENLVPLIQPDEHQPFTNWWRNFP